MKKHLIFPACAMLLFSFNTAFSQTAATKPMDSKSAWAGLENSIQSKNTVVNLVNTPILIEKDLAADKFFQTALSNFTKKDMLNAARSIREGAQELMKEAPKFDNVPQRKIVEQRVGELYALSLQVESGMIHDSETLRNSFADAEESVANRYYEGTNTYIDGNPEYFADRLLGLSVHLRNSKNYHNVSEKAKIGAVADEAAGLAADIRKMKPGENELSPTLKTRLNLLSASVKALKLDE